MNFLVHKYSHRFCIDLEIHPYEYILLGQLVPEIQVEKLGKEISLAPTRDVEVHDTPHTQTPIPQVDFLDSSFFSPAELLVQNC